MGFMSWMLAHATKRTKSAQASALRRLVELALMRVYQHCRASTKELWDLFSAERGQGEWKLQGDACGVGVGGCGGLGAGASLPTRRHSDNDRKADHRAAMTTI